MIAQAIGPTGDFPKDDPMDGGGRTTLGAKVECRIHDYGRLRKISCGDKGQARASGIHETSGPGGWNYAVRQYRPRKELLDGSWTFSAPVPVN